LLGIQANDHVRWLGVVGPALPFKVASFATNGMRGVDATVLLTFANGGAGAISKLIWRDGNLDVRAEPRSAFLARKTATKF
jgi:hypothetical protein